MGNCKSNNKTNPESANKDTRAPALECIEEEEEEQDSSAYVLTEAPAHNKKESMKSRWKRFAETTEQDMMENM